MKVKIYFTAIVFFQLLLRFGAAQNNTLKFNLVEGPNGKPLGKITGITQDSHGYMWFCGAGIYRYDGSRIISFQHDSLNKKSLGMTYAEKICAGDSGTVWIGGDGLDQYNPATGVFKHYKHDKNDPGSIVDDGVMALLKDHQGRLWVGTNKGLDRLDNKTGKFIHYHNEEGNPRSLSNDVINIIYEDHKRVIWVGTGWRWFGYHPLEGGLNRLEADDTFTRFINDPKDPHSLIDNKVNAIFEDSRDVFWVGTNGDGLNIMDRKNGRFERFMNNPAEQEELSGISLQTATTNELITFINEDGAGRIWVGTRGAFGINRYDTGTKKFTRYQSSNGFPDNSGWCSYTSKDGVLWISTEEANLYRVDPFVKPVNNIAIGPGMVVSSFLNGTNGSVWVGTDGAGLLQYDHENRIVHQYKNELSEVLGIPINTINSMYKPKEDSIWLGMLQGGIVIFNIHSQQFYRFRYDETMNDSLPNPVNSIVQGKEGYKWFSRWSGLVRYNPKDGSIQKYHPIIHDSSSISTERVSYVMQDRNGDIWVGGFKDVGETGINRAGLNRLNMQTGRFRRYLQGSTVDNIYEDTEGSIWVVCAEGLYCLKKGEDIFRLFFDANSPVEVDRVLGVVEDNTKNLWISTSSSIIKLNPARNKMYRYGSKFGILPNNPSGALFKSENGRILIGNQQGFYSFFPEELDIKTPPFTLNITDFFINNLPVVAGKKSPLTKPIEETTALELTYNQNNFGFNFAGIDYKEPEANKYFTMLENYDTVWREAKGEKSVYYFYVRPGDYVFHLRAKNSDGTDGEQKITIHVNPPWWKTWWAYSIYGLLFIAAIFAIYRYQKQRIIHIERQKRQQFELAQAKEIEKAYTELKATQAQLIQSEKMASLGELTAGIAHEIQNPLNFVNNFSEVSNELIDEMNQEIEKGNTNVVKAIVADVKQNLEKILHHGKRADAIVKGMLQHSRSSSGIKEPADINALADEYLRLAYHGLRAKDKAFKVTTKTDFDESIGKINIIPQDIGRVLRNLYNNAFYAATMPPPENIGINSGGVKHPHYKHEPTVWVTTKKTGDKVLISVRDNGPGIPQKIVDKIFQPFFTTKPTGQGTGLGLSLSYDIIKAHGGEIKVETEKREGSEFIIQLPTI